MLVLLTLAVWTQTAPEPLDAFRANYTSIRASVDFTYYKYSNCSSAVIDQLWARQAPTIADHELESRVEGKWACDGATEYFFFGSPESQLKEKWKAPLGRSGTVDYVPTTEAIYNGTVMASRYVDSREPLAGNQRHTINVTNNGELGPLSLGASPFLWWITYPFPRIIDAHFFGIKPERRTSSRDGHILEVETYKKSLQQDGWIQLQVFYDPEIGCLPRYARLVTATKESTWVKDMYLIAARPCGAGGFLPTEWYDAMYSTANSLREKSDLDVDVMLKPSGSRILRLGHFTTSGMQDRSSPVALSHLDGVTKLACPGGVVSLRPGAQTLSIADLKTALGIKLSRPDTRPLPPLGLKSSPRGDSGLDLNAEESRGFISWVTQRWLWLLVGIITITAFAAGLRRLRRTFLLSLIMLLSCSAGCSRNSASLVKLGGEFAVRDVIYDINDPTIPLKFVLHNDGNTALRLFAADGGCSCRKIDQSGFPANLPPGGAVFLDMAIANQQKSGRQDFVLRVETDHGTLRSIASFNAFPSHQLNIGAGVATLEGDEAKWEFDVTHRSVFRSSKPNASTELRAPQQFDVKKGATVADRIESSPGFMYEDTTYHLSLRDHRMGLNKAFVLLESVDGHKLVESPVVWQRLPFLSSIPERVILGSRPVRVFLRCIDDTVELTNVLSAPPGVKAVVSSTREVIVHQVAGARGIIDGEIEVGTTAVSRPPLRVRVVGRALHTEKNQGTATAMER